MSVDGNEPKPDRDLFPLRNPPRERGPKQPVKRLTLDEIDLQLNGIAQDPDAGPDRFRALKMLRTAEGGAAILTDPLSEAEVVDRLERLFRGPTSALIRIAYNRVYGQHGQKIKITELPSFFDTDDTALTEDEREFCKKASNAGSVHVFYKHFIEVKGPGHPRGFPRGRSVPVKRAFLYKQGVRIMLDRIEQRSKLAKKEAEGQADKESRGTDATGPPSGKEAHAQETNQTS